MRCINAIYLQAPQVPASDYKDFLNVCSVWHGLLKKHHHGEEKYFFHKLDEQWGVGTMASSFAEHAAFHDGVERFAAYIKSLRGREGEFNGAKLVELIDGFTRPLNKHFHNEIEVILALGNLENPTLVVKLWTDSVKKSIDEITLKDIFVSFPFIVLTHDLTYEGGIHSKFPPVPAVMLFLARHVFTMWNWTMWQYMPCDTWGRPKALHRPPEFSCIL